jgi:uncharacterized membrane protein
MNLTFGLTSLGIVHTIISLIAVAAGIIALVRDGRITYANSVGKWYVWTTALTCITGFGIFQHGGFGKPHVLGIITLLVLGLALVAARTTSFGRFSKYIEVVSYSATFLFHWIPAITETTTRLPLGSPLLSSPDAPELQKATAALLVLFLVGATYQVLKLRKGGTATPLLPVGVSPR